MDLVATMDTSTKDMHWLQSGKKLIDSYRVRKEDMDKLVMNFLVAEGYLEAAQKFQLESGTEPQIDIETITDRVPVKKAILEGNVQDAIQKVNDCFPEIRDTNPQLHFHLRQQQFIELIRNGKLEAALELSQKELAPIAEANQHLLEELERTVILLAFEDVNNCPSSELLGMSQRVKTSNEANIAILLTQIHKKDPNLSNALAQVILMQNRLNEVATDARINNAVNVAFAILTE